MKQFLTITLTVTLFLTSCSDEKKPVNLSVAREEVKQYYKSGKFDEELNVVIKEAKEKFAEVEFKENSVDRKSVV